MRAVTAAEARAALAFHMLGAPQHGALGGVQLQPHQREGASRLRRLLERDGGALLADDVGLGKTFTALALARGRGPTMVVAPAALRDTWLDAARRTDVAIQFFSVETLSHGGKPAFAPAFVIVDEAHHLRTPGTQRFAAAVELCRAARVLLLTATPVQNHEQDLRAILSLFLGQRAFALPSEALARHVVRRTAHGTPDASLAELPAVCAPAWLDPVDDSDCLDRILALPPAVPPIDGAPAAGFVAYSLTRQWASSRAALRAALRRRVARGAAMADALRSGRRPSHSELRAWTFADGAQQLAFPELLVAASQPCADRLLEHVDLHVGAVRRLCDWLDASPDPDVARASRLRAVLAAHPEARVVAFSEFAETVSVLYHMLLPHARVAMLTHTGGRVAGGPMRRREILARFRPGGGGKREAADRIDLLLTTDVLSEGVGLHDASVLLHLDLTWNPARLEQRVGRLRRMGAASGTVSVYFMRPPAGTERLLRMEERLGGKLTHAARTVGLAGTILPEPAPIGTSETLRCQQRIARLLAPWHSADAPNDCVVGAVEAHHSGALACVRIGRDRFLLAVRQDGATDAPDAVSALLEHISGSGCDVPAELAQDMMRRVEQWMTRREVGVVVDLAAVRLARTRRLMLRRVEGISRRTPRHSETRISPLVRAARAAATATLSAGAERVLDELARSELDDEPWLQAVGQFAELHARGSGGAWTLAALLLLVPPGYSPSAGSNSS